MCTSPVQCVQVGTLAAMRAFAAIPAGGNFRPLTANANLHGVDIHVCLCLQSLLKKVGVLSILAALALIMHAERAALRRP